MNDLSDFVKSLTPEELEEVDSLLAGIPPTATELFRRTVGEPEPWQLDALESESSRLLLLCSRQVGKSQVTAAKAIHKALYTPESLILIVSPSGRQSDEFFLKATKIYNGMGRPIGAIHQTQSMLALGNGSRIMALPGSTEETIVGFSAVDLLIIDEAALVADAIYKAVNPMLAVSQGTIIALTTPYGKRGWFYEAWTGRGEWTRVTVSANEVPRLISPKFLAEQRIILGPSEFARAYFCSFEGLEGTLLPIEWIQACEGTPLWLREPPRYPPAVLFVGVDIGRGQAAKAGRTVVWTWERQGRRLLARAIDVMHGLPYADQEQRIRQALARPGVKAARIDRGGIGSQLAETLEKAFPAIVAGVQLTQQRQGEYATMMRAVFETRSVEIPCDHELRDDLQLVERTVDQNGLPVIRTQADATGHADRFWAAALGLAAAQQAPVVRFGRPVSGRVR